MSCAVIISLFAMAVRMTIPYLYASLGEMYAQKSGVMNLGLEGMMTVGAFMAFMVNYYTGNYWLGFLAAVGGCLMVGLIYGALVIWFGVDQAITGIAFNLLILGSSSFFFRLVFGIPKVMPLAENTFPIVKIPLLCDIPWLGPVLFQQYGLTYLALLLVVFSVFFFQRTKAGIVIIACGESPKAAETRGVHVNRTRLLCVLVSTLFAAAAGTYLSTAAFNQYTAGMVSGRGYIAYALVIFGRWNPAYILLGALLFGFLEALALLMQVTSLIPHQFLLMAPYLLTVLALVVTSLKSRSARPACLGVRYKTSK
ncbi:ABC transporter permease [Pseudoflavonifractor sp. HCP28S3_F10]|uniref:ABC transporter permease n=1 Tax=Pseudoflavonifractor sp. HCP28S3_F10 TaxID=3438947 RepID=UPI003F894C0C